MNLSVEIDPGSGFCNGVVRAVRQAEEYLSREKRLYSLGAIVHNSLELERLKAKGLEILELEDVRRLHNETLLIRAHGEPPATYALAEANGIRIIDCTCPVVLQLQQKVKEVYQGMKDSAGQVVIFGKRGHAEVNGLVGQTEGTALVIGSLEEVERIDPARLVALFSQTTKDPDEYAQICRAVEQRCNHTVVFDTICRQVASRHKSLVAFARTHSIILFVSGKESSNGKVLFDLCLSENPRSRWLEDASQIDPSWFLEGDTVGVCGATSTPKWQLEETAAKVSSLFC
ncbi:MAG: 4-hydroxy-3-methylbut-2-enyl diphosphate reductase [Bacteroidales bacterium]|nr:4-hydroxy-3-methylbut-2-enyl diphosphate reductase [Bacteroidales bacterium]